MIRRVVELSAAPSHVSTSLEQLRIRRHVDDNSGPVEKSLPCEDVGLVVVDEPGTTYSHQALAKLMEHGAGVVVCGADHIPAGLLLPMSGHSEVVWRVEEQVGAPEPRKKRLWQQIVQAKIAAQRDNLQDDAAGYRRLDALRSRVRSGDASNVEAEASRNYWTAWLGSAERFSRDPDGGDPLNSMLNYGYGIVRAGVARAVVSAGLWPVIGLHHRHRGNPFCLADDLIEPLRPMVDRRVRALHRSGSRALDQATKAKLLEVLSAETETGGWSGPLMVGLHRYTASLVRCLRGEDGHLEIPAEDPEKWS